MFKSITQLAQGETAFLVNRIVSLHARYQK